MGGAEMYARNAAAMWESRAPWSRVVPGQLPGASVVEVPAQSATRVILRRPSAADPGPIGALMAQAGERGRVVVEDSFGALVLPAAGDITVDRMPVMVRPADGTGPLAGPRIRVVQAADEATLAQAERVIVDGFPQRALQPYRPGRSLPPLVLTVPGWRTWLAYRGREPAAACCTYDNGAAVGVYWLATLPEHRSHGLGRAVLSAALAACPGRPAALVATAAGGPLYSSLGFRAVSQAAWYRKPGPGRPARPGG
jgi:GNAT superfamily N-acetyltransferase